MNEIFPPKWPEVLVIIRHGESIQNLALDLFQDDLNEILKQKSIRDADIGLTDNGVNQASETGKYLAKKYKPRKRKM